ncbi:MAG: histidine kinase [Planctomycetaceae bacterium]|nr:histidine kinase [Planctomycetaceae bacterium]
MENPTVFLIEDDPSVRNLVESLLTSAGLPVESFGNPATFLRCHDVERPGCAVVDICLPGMTGLELQTTLADPQNGRPHIFLSGHADVAMAVQALSCGALGFLEKPFRAHELLQLVQLALERDRQQREARRKRRDISRRIESLTPREREVLERVVQGDQNKTIAALLNISQRTVEIHRSRVMEKLEAESVAGLVQLFMIHDGTYNPQC